MFNKVLFSAILSVGLSVSAQSAVTLQLTDNDPTPTVGIFAAGTSFTLTLNLFSEGEETAGLTYFLEAYTNSGSLVTENTGIFRIVDRDIADSSYSDPNFSDATVENSTSSQLDPRNNNDLGATLADPSNPNADGTFFIANFTLSIAPSAPAGNYAIRTVNSIFSDSVGNAAPFSQNAQFDITVVPEPGVLGLAFGGLAYLIAARRRRC